MKDHAGKRKVMVLNGMSQNLNIWGVFWTNQVQMKQSVVGRWQVGGGLQVPSGP